MPSPRLSFDNYIATEDGFDGGNVQLSVNGGGFAPIPAAAYTFNGPGNLATTAEGNDNPLAGQHAFSGSDIGSPLGTWGVSQVDLAAAGVAPGDTIQVRLAMGRDSCSGNDGWYVDNLSVVTCEDEAARPTAPTGAPDRRPRPVARRRWHRPRPRPTTTPTTTPPAVKVATTTRVKKPKTHRSTGRTSSSGSRSTRTAVTPTGRVVIKLKGVTIAKGKLVDGKVKITVKKNLKVGKQHAGRQVQGIERRPCRARRSSPSRSSRLTI